MPERVQQTNYLWLRGRDLFSFECLFLLFLLAGAYKSSILLASFNEQYDLTATTAIASVLVASLLFLIRGELFNFQMKYFGLFLIYVCLVVASYTMSGVRNEVASLKVLKFTTFNAWAFCAPLFIICHPARVERFLRLLFASTVLLSADALIRSNAVGMQRFVGSFGSESYHHLGVTSAIGLAMTATGILIEKRQLYRYALGVAGAMLVTSIMLAGARQAMVGLIVVAVYLLYSLSTLQMIRKFFIRYVAAALIFVVGFVGVRALVFTDVDTTWGSDRIARIFSAESGDALHDSMRPQLWSAGMHVWRRDWLWGAGFGAFSEVSGYPEFRHPHNLFVELLCELGLVGILVGALFWYWPAQTILRKDANPVVLTLGAIWVHLFTCAQVSGDITDNRQLFAFASLIVSYKASLSLRKSSVRQHSLATVRREPKWRRSPRTRQVLTGTR